MWTRVGDGEEVDLSRKEGFAVSGSSLTIAAVEVADRGVYVCTVMSAAGDSVMARASAIVEVGIAQPVRNFRRVVCARVYFPRLLHHALIWTDTDSELNHLSLPLLVSTELEVLGALHRLQHFALAVGALHPQRDSLRSLKRQGTLYKRIGMVKKALFCKTCLRVVGLQGLHLAAESLLLPVIPAATLSVLGLRRALVLSNPE